MGTRGLIGFIMPDGTVKGSYNQFDMYPDGAGKDLQQELAQTPDLQKLLPNAELIRWVQADENPTLEDLKYLADLGITPQSVSTGQDWYSALRDHHGSLMKRIALGIATDESDFIRASLFCEWAYLVDFRTGEMVILEGFNQDPARQAPYAHAREEDQDQKSAYFGCTEVFRGSLKDFLALDMTAFQAKLAATADAG